MTRKLFFNILIYISIAFLVYYLFKYNYIDIKGLSFDPVYLVLSVFFLWGGFFASTFGWKRILNVHGVPSSVEDAIKSHGLSVFAKYIPGKVWVILGRASKISLGGYSLKTTSFASLKEQLIYLWLGFLQALCYLLVINSQVELLLLVVLLIVGLTLFNFSGWFRKIISFFYIRIFKKELEIPVVKTKEVLSVIGIITFYWLLWDIAFWLFIRSTFSDVHFIVSFIFPLSISLGLIAVIVPGGFGIREGLIVVGLTSFGIPLELATTISVAARLWFISGEVFIFLLALVLEKFGKKRNDSNRAGEE